MKDVNRKGGKQLASSLSPTARLKFKDLTWEETDKILPSEGLILLGYRGSIAHGMYVPQEDPDSIDDKDVMGVFVAPPLIMSALLEKTTRKLC